MINAQKPKTTQETNGHFQAKLHCYLPHYIYREKEIGKDTERVGEREREREWSSLVYG